MKNEEILKMNKGKKFDIVFSNPPYDNGLHEKFDAKFFDICKGQICWVSPLSFLLGKRQNKKITDQLDKYAVDIEQINGNEYFDAAIGGTMGITYVDMREESYHNGSYITFDGKKYQKCEEIRTYSNDDLLMKFKSIIEPLYKNDNIDNHLKAVSGAHYKRYIVENPKNNPYIIIIPQFSGHSIARSKQIGEFYAMYSKDRTFENTGGKFNDLNIKKSRSGTKLLNFYIQFITEEETYNFWKYAHTLFFQTCMRLIKTALDEIGGGELKYIPWFDFSDSMFEGSSEDIDNELFKKYNISQNIINHLIIDLPNYYDLDLTKYKNVRVEN